jgi:hypothetical protein
MTTDFSHLSKLSARGRTAQWPMPLLDPDSKLPAAPYLTVKPASAANKPYYEANLKAVQASRVGFGAKALNSRALDRMRESDYSLFAQHVVTGWENVLNAAGNPAQFDRDNCEAFLRALPVEMFDELRAFCVQPSNFAEGLGNQLTDEEEADLGNA